jgi:hypothetical protein
MGAKKDAAAVTPDPALKALNRLVGRWTTEATHPMVPGVVVRGATHIEWLEGERFLILRANTDHPDFPDAISIIGFTDRDRVEGAGGTDPAAGGARQLTMHYFDQRGVFRILAVAIDDQSWRIWRDAPGFSQRFSGRFADSGDTIVGLWQLCQDDVNWHDDLQITYRRGG